MPLPPACLIWLRLPPLSYYTVPFVPLTLHHHHHHHLDNTHSQESIYSGYYKGHGFKYLIVITPDGLVVEVAGPYPGRVSDSTMVDESRLLERLAAFSTHAGRDYKLYGDPAFGASRFISKPFRRTVASHVESIRNTRMSRMRVTVEQAIGHITQQFSAMDFSRTERKGDGEVCKKYLVACFLRNCMTCIRGGNQISDYFGCYPPTLDVFLEERDIRDPLPPRLEAMGLFRMRTPDQDESDYE